MLDAEGKNIDGVMVAVPDHWHTHMSLECMQRGKHVYCEKPLTRTVSRSAAPRRRRAEVQGRHPDGQPGLQPRRHQDGLRDPLVGRHRRGPRSALLDGRRRGRPEVPGQRPAGAARARPGSTGTCGWARWRRAPTTRTIAAGAASSTSPPAARWATGWSTASVRRTWRCGSTWRRRSASRPSTWSRRTTSAGRSATRSSTSSRPAATCPRSPSTPTRTCAAPSRTRREWRRAIACCPR